MQKNSTQTHTLHIFVTIFRCLFCALYLHYFFSCVFWFEVCLCCWLCFFLAWFFAIEFLYTSIHSFWKRIEKKNWKSEPETGLCDRTNGVTEKSIKYWNWHMENKTRYATHSVALQAHSTNGATKTLNKFSWQFLRCTLKLKYEFIYYITTHSIHLNTIFQFCLFILSICVFASFFSSWWCCCWLAAPVSHISTQYRIHFRF